MPTLPNWAGLRQQQRNRTTGTVVSLYDGIAADMDTDGGRWQTVCEDHGCVISHATLETAQSHLAHPDEWCDVPGGCQGY